MSSEPILIYASAAVGKPTRVRKENFLKAIGTFLHFCQRNGLVRRIAIESNKESAPISTVLRQSNFTDEGLKFFRSSYSKWIRGTDKGAIAYKDTAPLELALSRIRGAPLDPATRDAAPDERKAEKAGIKTRRRTRRSVNHVEFIPPDFCLSKGELNEFKASGPHVYDKAEWHLEGEFPNGLDSRQAYVHTGMYIRWLIEMKLVADEFLEGTEPVKRGVMKGSEIYKKWGGILASDMLTTSGNKFTRHYYGEEYFRDFHERLATSLPSQYHVKDSDDNFLIIRACIQARFENWHAKTTGKRK